MQTNALVLRLLLLLLLTVVCTISSLPHSSHEEFLDDDISISNGPMPRGVFYYSNTDRNLRSKFKIPDLEQLDPMQVASQLLSTAAEAETKQHSQAGIDIPLPFSGRPLKLQIRSETEQHVETDEKEKKKNEKETVEPAMSREHRIAFAMAKESCLEGTPESCDKALDTFHQLRYGTSLLATATQSPYQKLIERRIAQMPTEDMDIITEDEDSLSESGYGSSDDEGGEARGKDDTEGAETLAHSPFDRASIGGVKPFETIALRRFDKRDKRRRSPGRSGRRYAASAGSPFERIQMLPTTSPSPFDRARLETI